MSVHPSQTPSAPALGSHFELPGDFTARVERRWRAFDGQDAHDELTAESAYQERKKRGFFGTFRRVF